MILKTNNSLFFLFKRVTLFLLASFLLTSCATKPWTEPLAAPETDSIIQLVDSIAAREAGCGKTLEADLLLSYENPLEKKSVSGFFLFSMPSAYKFVITNPFGQPIFAVTGDQASFQSVNTLRKNYLAGSLRSFGLRADIPEYLLQGDWADWLTARNQRKSQEIINIRADRDSSGVWLSFQNQKQNGVSHLLLDMEEKIFSDRILENGRGQTIAKITYGNWVNLAGCRQPLEIHVTELNYGTNIQLKLSNVLLSNETKDFRLKAPKGYTQQYMP